MLASRRKERENVLLQTPLEKKGAPGDAKLEVLEMTFSNYQNKNIKKAKSDYNCASLSMKSFFK